MAKYIDRKAVLSILTAKNAPWNAYEKIAALPTVDVQPVECIMYKIGDKVTIQIEEITTKNVCRFTTDTGKPTKLYKLKGIPMYFSEDDFKKIVGDLKESSNGINNL